MIPTPPVLNGTAHNPPHVLGRQHICVASAHRPLGDTVASLSSSIYVAWKDGIKGNHRVGFRVRELQVS